MTALTAGADQLRQSREVGPVLEAEAVGAALARAEEGDEGGDCRGHPPSPGLGGAKVTVPCQQPVLVVAFEVCPDGGADLLGVLVDAAEDDLLLQRAIEVLGCAVALRRADEGEVERHPEEPELVLDVLGHERAALLHLTVDVSRALIFRLGTRNSFVMLPLIFALAPVATQPGRCATEAEALSAARLNTPIFELVTRP